MTTTLPCLQQTQVFEQPPIINELMGRFNLKGKRVIFSWGDIVYNPTRMYVSPSLIAHEAVHGERQLDFGIDAWWRRYLEHRDFRIAEEVLAHRVEYQHLIHNATSRSQRRGALKQVAKRLSSQLYGSTVTMAVARKQVAL